MLTQGARPAAPTSHWLRIFRPNPAAAVRLFCLSPVGGGASFYSGWGTEWPTVEVAAVQMPGRERRIAERPVQQMKELVEQLRGELPFDKPFAFFGHSLGAMVAYELACALRDHDMRLPFHLFVSACPGPQVPRKRRNRHLLPEAELLEHLRTLGGTPEEVLSSKELMDMSLPVIRADFRIAETHFFTARAALPVPITALGGTLDPEVGENEVAAWRTQTSHGFALRMFPGDHFYLQPQAQGVWDEVLGRLASPTRPGLQRAAGVH